MSPLKFRAWDKKHKIMWYPSEYNKLSLLVYDNKIESDLQFYEPGQNKGSCGGTFCYDLPLELMQFTGLHDKHKKEIYEGDIVKLIYSDKTFNIAKITFRDYCFCYEFSNEAWGIISHAVGKFEVIGNIYEDTGIILGRGG
ncbi:MAG: YopX family protein [Candidatus Nanoarchaeia archaeon]|jgi:uncharacterized phage protein (TIGR01671 family)